MQNIVNDIPSPRTRNVTHECTTDQCESFSPYRRSPNQDKVEYSQKLSKLARRLDFLTYDHSIQMHYVHGSAQELRKSVRVYDEYHSEETRHNRSLLATEKNVLSQGS